MNMNINNRLSGGIGLDLSFFVVLITRLERENVIRIVRLNVHMNVFRFE